MFPANTSPWLIPMPTPISGLPEAAHRRFSSSIACCIAIAASSARSGSSLWAMGAPQSAMTASPMNLSRVPPCSKITSTISVKYSLRNLATASGPMASAIAVKPRMSLNSTVTGRRSPPRRMAPSCCAMSAATLGAK